MQKYQKQSQPEIGEDNDISLYSLRISRPQTSFMKDGEDLGSRNN